MESSLLKALEDTLEGIKQKGRLLESQTKFLNDFNARLETLLGCFEAYAFEEAVEKGQVACVEQEAPKRCKRDECTEDAPARGALETVGTLFGKNALLNDMAVSVFETIRANEPISLDDLVKSIKHSKYKVIEVLNRLIREKLVMKSFERVFVYRVVQ